MCCFSQPVDVSGTRIFARSLPDGGQALAYHMRFAAAGDLAMILPIPTPPGAPEDAVGFVDLSDYPTFFDALEAAFPRVRASIALEEGAVYAQSRAAPTLEVHDVGDFEASFVPRLADFERLDARFRLPPQTWDALPRYADWGFAVFKLRAPGGLLARLFRRSARRDVHPMAFRFPRRDPGALFFPTVHVHDGEAHPDAHFDHTLYAQAEPAIADTLGWTRADADALSASIDPARTMGLVGFDQPAFRLAMRGRYANEDVILRPGEGAASGSAESG